MPGKTRPSLLDKVLHNLQRSNLSETDKECIRDVFKEYVKYVKIHSFIENKIYDGVDYKTTASATEAYMKALDKLYIGVEKGGAE